MRAWLVVVVLTCTLPAAAQDAVVEKRPQPRATEEWGMVGVLPDEHTFGLEGMGEDPFVGVPEPDAHLYPPEPPFAPGGLELSPPDPWAGLGGGYVVHWYALAEERRRLLRWVELGRSVWGWLARRVVGITGRE